MENWGLITYREINLVYDEKTTPDYIKQNINVMIFHELGITKLLFCYKNCIY